MSIKTKKNLLTTIVIVSVILFIFAVYWKQTNQSNAEEVTVKPIKETSIKPKIKKDLSFLQDELPNTDSMVSSEADKKYQNQEATQENLSSFMSMVMMYNTPEEVMKSVKYYQENGNEEKVNEHIQFLLERFPDYEIPNEF
jgi:hypothetical protein